MPEKIWCSSGKPEVLYTTCLCSLNSCKKKEILYISKIYMIATKFWRLFQKKKNNINTLCLEKKKSFSSPSAARAQTLTLRSLAKLTLLTDLFVDFYTLNAYFNSFALLECMKKKKKNRHVRRVVCVQLVWFLGVDKIHRQLTKFMSILRENKTAVSYV